MTKLLDEQMFGIERTHRVYCSAYNVWDRENTHSILGRRQCYEQREHTDYTASPNLSVARDERDGEIHRVTGVFPDVLVHFGASFTLFLHVISHSFFVLLSNLLFTST